MPPAADAAAFAQTLRRLAAREVDPVAGFFGPASLTWQINREALLLLGGMRALLLQIAHPKVAQGVADHSRFRDAPLARGLRTFRAVHGMLFGSVDEAMTQALKVRAIHARIYGTMPELGHHADETYTATDPLLLRWVWATLIDSAVVSYGLFFRPLSETEKTQFYDEGKRFAQLFGLTDADLPADWVAFQTWFAATVASPLIQVTPTARTIAQALLSGTVLLRVGRPLNAVLTASMLDVKLRKHYGLRWGRTQRLGFQVAVASIRTAARLLPRRLRWMPAAKQAYRRVGYSASGQRLSASPIADAGQQSATSMSPVPAPASKKAQLRATVLPIINQVKHDYRLAHLDVRVKMVKKKDYYMALTGEPPSPNATLYVDRRCRQFSRLALTGLIAHELAHYFHDDERDADRFALEHGYQAALVAFHTEHGRKYKKYNADEGMTLKEIRDWSKRV